MNEGPLGSYEFSGERAATDDHPVVIRFLPLASTVAAAVPAGTLLKEVAVLDEDDNETVVGTAYAPFDSTDDLDDGPPVAVVDVPCDPTGDNGDTTFTAVVHGTVKSRLLKTGDNEAPTELQLTALAKAGVFPA